MTIVFFVPMGAGTKALAIVKEDEGNMLLLVMMVAIANAANLLEEMICLLRSGLFFLVVWVRTWKWWTQRVAVFVGDDDESGGGGDGNNNLGRLVWIRGVAEKTCGNCVGLEINFVAVVLVVVCIGKQ